MPVNNALTPEGSNALGAAFGYYPQLRRNRQFNDPQASAEMPLQFLRGRLAGTVGMPSDILNTFRSPMPMEMYGQTDYAPQQQVPYGSQELMRTLPLAPTSPAGQLAGNVGSVVPLSPAEILQAARLARQTAMATGKVGKSLAKHAGEEFNATLLGERPNTMLGAITPQPKFIFVGENSKTWNKADATKALEMEKAGASPEDIWASTGTFRGPEGKLRQEISDLPARANFPPQYSDVLNAQSQFQYGTPYYSLPLTKTGLGEMRKKVSDLADIDMERYKTAAGAFPHPDLYKAYPELANVKVEPFKNKDIYGSYGNSQIIEGFIKPRKKIVNESITANAPNEEVLKNVLAHEAQHAIQAREGFARGGNINEFATGPMFDQIARDLTADLSQVVTGGVSAKPLEVLQGLKYTDPKDIEPIIKKYGFNNIEDARSFIYDENQRRTPLGQYQRLAGEAEARATQARLNMTAEERRAKFPYESYDVPINQLIIRK